MQERIYYEKPFFNENVDEQGRYYADVYVRDVWEDIKPIINVSKQRYGYATQKPLELYERIIQASSTEGDIVLDPFAGCATTCVAAERLSRKWIGIDIWNKAQDAVVDRLEQEGLFAPKYIRKTKKARQTYLFAEEFTFTNKVPKRSDFGETDVAYLEPIDTYSKEPWEKLNRSEMVKHLERAQKDDNGWVTCGGCGRELEVEFMELDHISPRAEGGSNDITNRILLCGPCNRKKKHKLTLRGLRDANKRDGWMDDEIASKNAQNRARNMAEKVKRGKVKLRLSVD